MKLSLEDLEINAVNNDTTLHYDRDAANVTKMHSTKVARRNLPCGNELSEDDLPLP